MPHSASGQTTRGEPRPGRIFSVEEMREIDRLCVEEFGIPSVLLMEHASLGLAEAVAGVIDPDRDPLVTVVAGKGNNGGDGLACARLLANRGIRVRVVYLAHAGGAAPTGDAGIQLGICERMGIELDRPPRNPAPNNTDDWSQAWAEDAIGKGSPSVIVDAVFGTGLSRAPEGVPLAVIGAMNALRAARPGLRIISADVPSGLDATSGTVPGEAVVADLTVTFVGLKEGFVAPGAARYLGEISVRPIGAPCALLARYGR